MRSKVNFGHPKWAPAAILPKISKQIKVAYRFEMARNVIKSEFRKKTFTKKLARFEQCLNRLLANYNLI